MKAAAVEPTAARCGINLLRLRCAALRAVPLVCTRTLSLSSHCVASRRSGAEAQAQAEAQAEAEATQRQRE